MNIEIVHYIVTVAASDEDNCDFPVVGAFTTLKEAVAFCRTFKPPVWIKGNFQGKTSLAIDAWANGIELACYLYNGKKIDSGQRVY